MGRKRWCYLVGLMLACVVVLSSAGLCMWYTNKHSRWFTLRPPPAVDDRISPRPPQLKFLRQLVLDETGQRLFVGPYGIHCTESRVYVADDLGHCILVFDRSGRLLQRIGRHGTAPGQFAYLDRVITDGEGRLIVADTGNNRIQVLDQHGRYLTELRSWGLLGRFHNPRDLCFDSQGRLYVADWEHHCVQTFDARLRFVGRIGGCGSEPGRFRHPVGLLCIRDHVFVSDHDNHRVQVFERNGAFVRAIGDTGPPEERLRHPAGLAYRKGCLFVADQGHDRVQIFTFDGAFLACFGESGEEAGQLRRPTGLDFDNDDRLYVIDAGNHRIQVFQAEWPDPQKSDGAESDS